MKNLKLGISALALVLASTAFAQTTTNPWVIGVGAHAENHIAAGGNAGDVFGTALGKKRAGLYNFNNFTTTPPLSKLTVARNLNRLFVLDWQTTVGNVDNKKLGLGKEFFLQTGLGLQFKLAGFWNEEAWFDPFVRVGANYLRHDLSSANVKNGNGDVVGANHFTLATGVGANIWLSKNVGLGLQGDYVSTPTNKSVAPNFWQAGASLLFRFGNTDRDKDGIKDNEDACPDTPGLAQFQGCPDTDGDGVADKEDNCPEVAGPKENNGCPWPDTDGDGILDKDDKCPSVAGPAANNGCPWPDTDGDGILDKDDACPSVAGVASSNPSKNGCPKENVSEVVTKTLKDILFDFNKATIKAESSSKLDVAASIIKEATGENFVIVGSTDKKGSDAYNLKLSRERAASVMAALEARGVNPANLKSIGIGEQEAQVAETATDAERQADRKVVVRAISGAEWNTYKKSDVPATPVKKSKKSKK